MKQGRCPNCGRAYGLAESRRQCPACGATLALAPQRSIVDPAPKTVPIDDHLAALRTERRASAQPPFMPLDRRVSVTFLDGPLTGRQIFIDSPATVFGSSEDADVRIADPTVSPRHARLLLYGRKVLIEDLDSDHGVIVNGKSLQRHQLDHLDEVRLGAALFLFNMIPSARGAAAQPRADIEALDRQLLAGRDGRPAAAPEPRLEVVLHVTDGPDKGKRFHLLAASTTVGRESGDILLADSKVSRRHLHIELLPNSRVYVKDLDTTNGTLLNGSRVSIAQVRDGDRLVLGDSTINIVIRQRPADRG